MQAINDFLCAHPLGVAAICGWYLIRRLHQAAPDVTGAAKDAAGKKAVSLLLRFFK